MPTGPSKEYYRSDGVKITHDPFAPGMADKYGRPGATDPDGFDPYADSVGPGIYGGGVLRDGAGSMVIGQQYQSHNPRPGPVYDGTGYSAMSKAISCGTEAVKQLLADHPELAHEVSTGGARPLHVCGMSQCGQHSTAVLLAHGADPRALDTYGYTPLHRMASNNLPEGARALLRGGAAADARATGSGETPLQVAEESRAHAVAAVLRAVIAGGSV
eukprot:jgi/Ulvmu1/11436/UM076_0010.1